MSTPRRILPVVFNDRESEARTPSQPLIVLPPEARDPFLPIAPLPAMHPYEADLTRIAPDRPSASGESVVVTGQVLDEDRRAVRRALIEVWNANTHGRYAHISDAQNAAPLDPFFYGFGRLLTDDAGTYRLKTIKPGPYMARSDIGWWRPPHIHFSLLGCGVRLVTQMYFPDEPLNARDHIHLTIPPAARSLSIGMRVHPGLLRFDIVVRGRDQTPPG